MSRLIAIVPLLAALVSVAACTVTSDGNQQPASAPTRHDAQTTATPTGQGRMRDLVRADIAQVMRDIARAEEASPAIALSSNPFTYAEISPALDRLVARGTPALESIAEEIEDSPENGLREYLLAIAGQRIMGVEKTDGTWSTAKEWARYYRTSK